VNISIVSSPPSNGLLINLNQTHVGYNYYTSNINNNNNNNNKVNSNSKEVCELTHGSSTNTNINKASIESIETIADEVYKTISNEINNKNNHVFSGITNKSNTNYNYKNSSFDATVISFKPFEDSTIIS